MSSEAALSIVSELNVSRETEQLLDEYVALILKWNAAINLISKTTVEEIWKRHLADSAQIYPHISTHSHNCVDLGSGGGFPGIVLAILDVGHQAGRYYTLVESDQRKGVFLREVARQLELPVKVISQRAESVPPLMADLLTARALAPLKTLIPFARRHLHHDGACLFLKGESYAQELREAKQHWSFQHKVTKSVTDDKSVILEIQDIHDV